MQNDLTKLIFGIITVIVGIVLLQAVADQSAAVTDNYALVNETVAIASTAGQTGGVTNVALTSFANASATFVDGQDINVTTAGVISTNVSDGNYNISYAYTGTNYVADSTARTFVDLIPLFFAIAVVMVGVAIAINAMRGLGIVNF